MNNFKCSIHNVQHIKLLDVSFDLSENKLFCIVGRNGVGKTTLIRAIKNFVSADTFEKTASPYIYTDKSLIKYEIDGQNGKTMQTFRFNSKIKQLDTKEVIDDSIRKNIYAELPIPHGERFNSFQKLSDIDKDMRQKIAISDYKKPDKLINFLKKVYSSSRFQNLKEVKIKGKYYYFILKDDDYYIREDYLSSGEFFVIGLYKLIQKKCKLIVIDEIDISLDASAQVNLLNGLRELCKNYEVNIVFTTHSLALMKMLESKELFYMEKFNDVISLENKSYGYIKSILFGFQGFDKYILTEDDVLKDYLKHIISKIEAPIFYQFKIIYIGGSGNVVDLMKRNEQERFFSSKENVITVLDGDQSKYRICRKNEKVHATPFQSIEKDLKEYYEKDDLDIPRVKFSNIGKEKVVAKNLYKALIEQEKMSNIEIFDFLNSKKQEDVEIFKNILEKFLSIRCK
jgi:ABC-type cobalamin/Fe3+-siderophores transport system ATPase subunit